MPTLRARRSRVAPEPRSRPALAGRGLAPVAVAGRERPTRASTAAASRTRLGAPAVARRGRRSRTPTWSCSRRPTARSRPRRAAVAPSLEPGALVVHLAGAATLDGARRASPRPARRRVGALHPLQSLPTAELGRDRLPGVVVRGRRRSRSVERLALTLGLRPFRRRRRRPRRATTPPRASRRTTSSRCSDRSSGSPRRRRPVRGVPAAGAGHARQRRRARPGGARSPGRSPGATVETVAGHLDALAGRRARRVPRARARRRGRLARRRADRARRGCSA